MQRRLVVAIVFTVLATLLLSGLGTLLAARIAASTSVADSVEQRAEAFASIFEGTELLPPPQAMGQLGVSVVRPDALVGGGLPAGVQPTADQTTALLRGETVTGGSGDRDSKFFALASFRTGDGSRAVVVVAESDDQILGSAPRFFVFSGAATLAIGIVVALVIARGLIRPVIAARRAARQIAAGDLSARVPEPSGIDELAGLAHAINEMAEALQRSRGLEQQFLLSISHDLRTPLTSIRGYAEALADGTTTDVATASTRIRAEARRLERLVGDLLDLAKLDSQQFRFDPQVLDVGDVVLDITSTFEFEAAGFDVTIEADATLGLVAAVDPDRLAQLLANLLENALKFATSVVTVEARPGDDGMLTVSIHDDGPGIPAADLPHVFERLYVATSQPVRKESGSGLGLAIVRELVTAMGGTVRAESPPDGGTRMIVSLPAIGAGAAAARTPA